VQARIQHGVGAGEFAALHQRDDEGVFDQFALSVAAADAHHLASTGSSCVTQPQ